MIAPKYASCFRPSDLAFLAGCIDKTASVSGAVLEVGCFAGATTVWLNRHMTATGVAKPYVAIDTFAGFTERDIAHEINYRGKSAAELKAFRSNHQAWFDRTMELNGIERVKSVKADAATFDYASLGSISFALIDVDLYLPSLAALKAVLPQVAPGGMIVVDDCAPKQAFDGALQAYEEFVCEAGLPHDIRLNRLGVIQIR